MADVGGKRAGAGRKSKADEERIRDLMKPHSIEAIKCLANIVKSKESRDTDKISAAKIIIAYTYGNPKDTVDTNLTVNNFELKDIINFDKTK